MPCQPGELTLFYVVRGQEKKNEGSADSNTQSDLGRTTKDLELSSGFLVLTATYHLLPLLQWRIDAHATSLSMKRNKASKQAYILFKRINKCIFSCSVYLIWGYQDSLTHNKDHLRD